MLTLAELAILAAFYALPAHERVAAIKRADDNPHVSLELVKAMMRAHRELNDGVL